MRKLVDIVTLCMITIIILAINSVDYKANPDKPIKTYQQTLANEYKHVNMDKEDYYLMTVTAYSRYLIADKYNDGMTASNTPIREGVAAINVDYIDGRWLIKSPLNLGDKIYIEDLGNYSVEDTGKFAERNHIQDMWTIDIYMESYEEAVEFGRQLRRVFVLSD